MVMIKVVIFDYGSVLFRNLSFQKPVFDLAKDLKSQGYQVALLSNMYSPLAWIARHFGRIDIFDPIIISSEVGFAKPDKKIYKIILKELDIPAKYCLFIDDRAENIATAKNLGMTVLLARSTDQIVKETINILSK
jgi:putative hydrolase of the HAD superfamily